MTFSLTPALLVSYRLDPTTKKATFSEVAVSAFIAYMNYGDDGPLSKIFEDEYLQTLKKDILYHYGYLA